MEKFSIYGQNLCFGTGTESGYWYSWSEAKWYWYHLSGIGTQSKKGVGTDTDASSSPDFCTLALLSPNSSTNSIGTLIND